MAFKRLLTFLKGKEEYFFKNKSRDTDLVFKEIASFLSEEDIDIEIKKENIYTRNETITIRINSSVLKYQLFIKKDELLSRINRKVEPLSFSKIRLL